MISDQDFDKMEENLVNNYHYKKSQAEEIVKKILNMDEKLLSSFYVWYQTGEFPKEPVIAGFNAFTLSKLLPLKPPAIFLLLDWIKREPDEALKAMQHEYGQKIKNITDDW